MNFLFEHLAIATYVIGFVAVFFFSLDEFNAPEYPYVEENDHEDQNEIDFSPWAKLASPALPRYMADPISYSVSMYCFALIAAAIYVWFALILSSLHVKPDALPALISASIMVGLAKFDDFDFIKEKAILKLPKKLVYGLAKSLLHSYLFIPKLGQEIFDILCFARIDYGSEQARANLDTLLAPEANTGVNPGRHLDLADFKTPGNSRTMTARWARLSYFKLIIEQWAQDDRFKSHVNDRSLKWRLLKNAYNNLTEQMIRFRDKDADMAPEKETELSKKIDHLLANCYRLLSCVTVMASKSQEHPTQLLQETGLRVNKIQVLQRQGQIFRLVFVMFPLIALMVGIFAFSAQSDVGDVIQRIFTCIESSIYLFVLPILFIISVNQHMAVSGTWAAVCSDTPPKNFFDRPLGLYLILPGISYAAALFFMMLRISPTPMGSWLLNRPGYPWGFFAVLPR